MAETRASSQGGADLPDAATGGGHRPRASWWSRIFRSAAASAGLLAAGVAAEASPTAAENSNYRSAAAAPESWRTFAKQLQQQVEERLAADNERARHFQDYLTRRNQEAGLPPLTFVLRTWVLSDGQINRVEFDGIDDAAASDDLRALLVNAKVGAPPPEMLQPLRLRLSLPAKEPTRQGE